MVKPVVLIKDLLSTKTRESIRGFQVIKGAARQVLHAFDKDRDKLSHAQWTALEELEDAVYGQGE